VHIAVQIEAITDLTRRGDWPLFVPKSGNVCRQFASRLHSV